MRSAYSSVTASGNASMTVMNVSGLDMALWTLFRFGNVCAGLVSQMIIAFTSALPRASNSAMV